MTATGSIICGVDGSESAKGAARFASTLSARLGLPLLFVRVIEGAAGGESAGVLAERLQRVHGGFKPAGNAVKAACAGICRCDCHHS